MNSLSNLKLVLAGPGAGKTHDMVERIASQLERLEPHRFLAVITYTQAATEEIRNRLNSKCNIPPNVFIGTIHSFLNRFIFTPFGSILGIVPFEKTFIESVVLSYTPKISYMGPHLKNKIAERLLPDGLVTYDKIIEKSQDLISKDRILKVVANRIQMLFIDEYQDATQVQHKIFNTLLKFGKTQLYCVGDPEQYIMGFTYRGKKRPSFADLPINRFPAERIPKKENYRSHKPIVDFVNHFHTEIQQESKRGDNPVSKVVFIESLDLNEIVRAYQALCSGTSYEKPPLHFYLSFENKTFEQAMQFGLTPLVAERTSFKTTLETALEIICGIVGLTKKQISERYKLESLQIRKMGIDLLKKIAEGKIVDKPSLMNFIAGELRLEPNLIDSSIGDDLLHSLRLIMRGGKNLSTNHQFSSIHKAKGLEADTVLVLAKTNKELTNWLILNKDERISNKDDSCRIGYVAFTRAKILLCISCLEKVSDENRKTLEGLSVSFIKSISEPKQATLP